MRKIAVLRANALGDFIFILPALTALRETYREAEITLLGRPWHKQLERFERIPLDRVRVVPPNQGVWDEVEVREDPAGLHQFFAAMQAEQFDLAIQLHGGGQYSNPFVRKLGARLSIGLQAPDAEPLDLVVPYRFYQREVLRYLEVVSLVGAKTVELDPVIHTSAAGKEESWRFYGKDRPFVVVHPGATDLRRRWPAEKFAVVGDWLAKRGYEVVVTGTKSEAEIVATVVAKMEHKAIICCDQLSLGGFAALLERAALTISNDTGPYHLAGALERPTVGIFWCVNVVMAGPTTQSLHRLVSAWRIHCPLCGTDVLAGSVPFSGQETTSCAHEASFVADVAVGSVLSECDSLLAN